MSNELMKQSDGFEGYEDQIEGGDQRQAGGVIRGVVLKFTNEAAWTVVGEKMRQDIELIAVGIGRVVQKWIDQLPAETRVLGPGEKFPDLKELNDKTPRSEWTEGPNGEPRGPWQAQHIVYLLDPATMDRYSFPTGTVGGAICVRELVDKTKWMRRYREANVYAVVTLADKFMNTKFGGRQRPHFVIKRWVDLDGNEEEALPAPVEAARLVENSAAEKPKEKPAAAAPAAKTTTTKKGVTRFKRGATTVEEPSLREELNDDLPPWATETSSAADTEASKKPAPTVPAGDDRSPAAKARLAGC
jgi:hypothetical protein